MGEKQKSGFWLDLGKEVKDPHQVDPFWFLAFALTHGKYVKLEVPDEE